MMRDEQKQRPRGCLSAAAVFCGAVGLISFVVCVWVCLANGYPDPNNFVGPFFYLFWEGCIAVLGSGLIMAVVAFVMSVSKSTDGWSLRRVATAAGIAMWCLLLIADILVFRFALRSGSV